MRKFKMGFIALVATAGLAAVPATSAMAGNQSASSPATATGICAALVGCGFDVLNNNHVVISPNVTAQVAANACGINVVQVTVLGIGQIIKCSNGNSIERKW